MERYWVTSHQRLTELAPQLGYMFKMGEKDACLNLKAYWGFFQSTRDDI